MERDAFPPMFFFEKTMPSPIVIYQDSSWWYFLFLVSHAQNIWKVTTNSNRYFSNINSLYPSQYCCIGISSNTCAVHQQTLTPLTVVKMCSYLLTFLNVVLIYRVKSTSLGYFNLSPLTSNSHSLSNISVFTKVHRTGSGSCWPKALVKINNSLYSFYN